MLAGRPTSRASLAYSDRKGLIFPDIVERKPAKMWVEKVCWSSNTTTRFLAVMFGVSVVDPSCTMTLWSTHGIAGITKSSVFAMLSCR